MGLLRNIEQPQVYLKIMSVSMRTVPNSYGAELAADRLPARVEFNIHYRTFESYEKRVEWETNPYITYFDESRMILFLPDLPDGWETTKTEPGDIQEEAMIARAYVGLGSLAEFAGWEAYQPEVTI